MLRSGEVRMVIIEDIKVRSKEKKVQLPGAAVQKHTRAKSVSFLCERRGEVVPGACSLWE